MQEIFQSLANTCDSYSSRLSRIKKRRARNEEKPNEMSKVISLLKKEIDQLAKSLKKLSLPSGKTAKFRKT